MIIVSKQVRQLSEYIAEYIKEELERGNEVTPNIVAHAIEAFESIQEDEE